MIDVNPFDVVLSLKKLLEKKMTGKHHLQK
jgi:hypothetical protein